MRSKTIRKKNRSLWVRRIVSTTILLLSVVAIIWVVVQGFRWVGSVINAEQQRSVARSLPKPVEIGVCDPNMVKVSVEPSATQILGGEKLVVTVNLLNEAKRECTVSADDLNVQMTLGNQATWTPTECVVDNRTLLLVPEQEWVTTFDWDGTVYANCEQVKVGLEGTAEPVSATAPEGTYSLTVDITGAEKNVTKIEVG